MPDYPPKDAETDLKVSKPSKHEQLLRDFKGDLRAPLPLHPLEVALIWIAAINVCSLPWMLGGMRAWAQFITLGLSVVALVVALMPRHYEGDYTRGNAFTLHPWRNLLRWPLFWIGVIFFAYVLIQALNPAWEYVDKGKTWTMRRIDHVEWLPTGMITPFRHMNTWRQMMIWAAPFLLACSLWTGITRRKSITTLLTAIVANATLLAIVGIVARYTSAPRKILWFIDSPVWYHFSSFIYKNHAGSFFALTAGLALALAVFHHDRAARHLRRSSPAGLYIFLSLILLVAVLLTYSRAAILITGIFLLLVAFIGGVRLIITGSARQASLIIAIFCLGLVGFSIVGGKLVNSEKTLDRILNLANEDKTDFSVLTRSVAWQAGYDMASENPAFGWGSGGFRYLFPRYQMSRPEITWRDQKRQRNYMFWQHAHNDYLQAMIETGRSGIGILLAGSLSAFVTFLRKGGRRNLSAITLSGAGAMTLAHAAVDFPLQNPAILLTLTCVFVAALILPGFEQERR